MECSRLTITRSVWVATPAKGSDFLGRIEGGEDWCSAGHGRPDSNPAVSLSD